VCIDWSAINAGATPTLAEYAALEEADHNAFWRLDSGHHQNLLDAALAEVKRLRDENETARVVHRADVRRTRKAEAAIARVQALCDEAGSLAFMGSTGDGWLHYEAVAAALDGGGA
jgi:hypothetical protein